jgi:hypothetical protein
MSELFFGETAFRGGPVSLAVDLESALMLGASTNSMHGWRRVNLYLGPLVITFTRYGRRHERTDR